CVHASGPLAEVILVALLARLGLEEIGARERRIGFRRRARGSGCEGAHRNRLHGRGAPPPDAPETRLRPLRAPRSAPVAHRAAPPAIHCVMVQSSPALSGVGPRGMRYPESFDESRFMRRLQLGSPLITRRPSTSIAYD